MALNRRDFFRFSAGLPFAGRILSAGPDIPQRPLGSTGKKVSILGMGGYHIGNVKDVNECVKLIRTGIDRGITFMDNCWDYHDGKSEEWMGQALRDGYREKVFLMSKIDSHSKAGAAKQIDESLKRLKTDHVDLMQFHEVIRPGDPDKIFAPGGAAEAMLEAKKAGKVLHIGFTGHKDPQIHLKMLEAAKANRYPLETVQLPLNPMDAHFKSFAKTVVPVAVDRGIGVLGMKPMGNGIILKSNTVTPVECLHYAMNLPTSVVISGMDSVDVLEQGIQAAVSFKPLDKSEVAAILAKTASAGKQGEFELFKTSTRFDGTVHNPQWLG